MIFSLFWMMDVKLAKTPWFNCLQELSQRSEKPQVLCWCGNSIQSLGLMEHCLYQIWTES